MSAPSPDHDHPGWALPRRDKLYTLTGCLLGLLLAALDQTIVATAGPAIQREFTVPPALYAWITTAYLVANVVMVPVYGKLSDLYGRKRILLAGIGIFLTGSLLCGTAWGIRPLIAFRFAQGLGAASLFTSAFSVIADLFPPAERGRYGGLISATFGVASVLGPVVGGIITDAVGWHWVFLINLPIGLVALALIVTRMPSSPRTTPAGTVDVAGVALLFATVVPLLIALSFGRTTVTPGQPGLPWTSPVILALLATTAIGAATFRTIERRARDPIVDFAMYREPLFARANLASFVLGASFLAGPTFVPLFLVNVAGTSATGAGLAMLPLTFGIVLGSAVGGQLASRVGRPRRLVLWSLALLATAFAAFAAVLTPETTPATVSRLLFAIGLGVGPTLPLLTLIVQNSVPIQRIGVATAAVTFARGLGQATGLGVLGSVFAAAVGSALAPVAGEAPAEGASGAAVALDAAARTAVTDGIVQLYLIGVVVTVVAALVVARMPDAHRPVAERDR
jgi:EmrB/QacA subfamily drug resistance transporter